MKRIIISGMIMLACASFAIASGYRNIRSSDVKSLLAKNKNAFLLDVRTPDEYRQAHLRGAVLIPVNEVERRLAEVPRNRVVVVYCAVGSRSGMAAALLAGKGYGEVYNVSDGIVGWYRNGFPIER